MSKCSYNDKWSDVYAASSRWSVSMKWVNQVSLYTSQAAWKPTWGFPLQLQPVLIGLCMRYARVHTQAESVCTKASCWGDVFKLCFYRVAAFELVQNSLTFPWQNDIFPWQFILFSEVKKALLIVIEGNPTTHPGFLKGNNSTTIINTP